MKFSYTRLFPHLSGSMLSPSNVFVPKVSGAQSDATYYHPEQDIIETHNKYSLAIYSYLAFMNARPKPLPQVVLRTQNMIAPLPRAHVQTVFMRKRTARVANGRTCAVALRAPIVGAKFIGERLVPTCIGR